MISDTSAEYIMFGCDDVVYIRDFNVEYLESLFQRFDPLGISLRLGLNVTRNMFFGGMPTPPDLCTIDDQCISWNIEHPARYYDWTYPWELDGTIYSKQLVQTMLGSFQCGTPNQLEAHGYDCIRQKTQKRSMLSYKTSRLIVPTVNMVQSDFPNGIIGFTPITPATLVDCWQAGLRMDLERFEQRTYDQIHVPDFYLRREV